jgi:hypothetical protein
MPWRRIPSALCAPTSSRIPQTASTSSLVLASSITSWRYAVIIARQLIYARAKSGRKARLGAKNPRIAQTAGSLMHLVKRLLRLQEKGKAKVPLLLARLGCHWP